MIASFKQYLVEETKTIYFTWGRMNPPTIGHGKLLDKLSQKAGSNPYRIYVTQSNDQKSNPLTYMEKIKTLRKMFPRHARSKHFSTIPSFTRIRAISTKGVLPAILSFLRL